MCQSMIPCHARAVMLVPLYLIAFLRHWKDNELIVEGMLLISVSFDGDSGIRFMTFAEQQFCVEWKSIPLVLIKQVPTQVCVERDLCRSFNELFLVLQMRSRMTQGDMQQNGMLFQLSVV